MFAWIAFIIAVVAAVLLLVGTAVHGAVLYVILALVALHLAYPYTPWRATQPRR